MKMTNLLVIKILLLKKSEATRQEYNLPDFDACALFKPVLIICVDGKYKKNQ